MTMSKIRKRDCRIEKFEVSMKTATTGSRPAACSPRGSGGFLTPRIFQMRCDYSRHQSQTGGKFCDSKVQNAVRRAALDVRKKDDVSQIVADHVKKKLEEKTSGIIGVEDVQDEIEDSLMKLGYYDIAKSYILFRQKMMELRGIKTFFGVTDDLKLDVNAIRVLERRYLQKDEKGRIIETPKQMLGRVTKAIAAQDRRYDIKKENVKRTEQEFFKMLVNLEFMPNSPTLMNAGTRIGQLSACFVLPIEDNISSIFEAVKEMAIIHQSGGGTGFSFSRLRPKGDSVRSTMGVASGPVSFMRVFDATTEVIKQGGKRRGANMGVLDVTHPDIEEFITIKQDERSMQNFNLSVAVSDDFMDAVLKDKKYPLINPRTGKTVRKEKARKIFDLIANLAWRTGDPGIIFIDEINRKNPTPQIGRLESTNPCGEVPLLPYESCNLGSINLAKMVKEGKIDWLRLREVTRLSVHFLDNVIDANKYPLLQVKKMTYGNRKIGLGVMGFAEMLIELGVAYDSEEALRTADRLMSFVHKEALQMSTELALKRGSFPNLRKSVYTGRKMRNATVIAVAPTGSISVIAGCSSGIEPLFAVSFIRDVMEGTKLLTTNPYFERIAKERGFYSERLMEMIAQKGSVQGIKEVPKDVQRIFVTALDIRPEWHVRMQAAFQKHVDNAVSKTVNMPQDAAIDDVKNAFMMAYRLRCKGIIVYRYASKPKQVLYTGKEHVTARPDYSGGCPGEPYCQF